MLNFLADECYKGIQHSDNLIFKNSFFYSTFLLICKFFIDSGKLKLKMGEVL